MIGSLFAFLLAAAAAPPSPTAPLDFLVGHCWAGKPKPTQTDRHCFRRGKDGSIFDHHELTETGKPTITGDTRYRWDPALKAIRYTYRDSRGGVLSSLVKRNGNTIDFGTAPYRTPDGTTYVITTRWTVFGPTSYQSEMTSPSFPMMKRTTRFERVS
jgi:hypothetical protein